jgi:hypothetical protein
MKDMRPALLTGLAAALALAVLVPAPVAAQAPPPAATPPAATEEPAGTDLRMERKTRRVIVQPRPAPETFARDAAEVTEQVERERRARELMEDAVRPSRRPDLDPDVRGGIQSDNLRRALPR